MLITLIDCRGHITYVTPPFPKFPSYGVMHSKLMLLLHERFLRIVVSSGNLVPYDYDEVQNVSGSLLLVGDLVMCLDCVYPRSSADQYQCAHHLLPNGYFKASQDARSA